MSTLIILSQLSTSVQACQADCYCRLCAVPGAFCDPDPGSHGRPSRALVCRVPFVRHVSPGVDTHHGRCDRVAGSGGGDQDDCEAAEEKE